MPSLLHEAAENVKDLFRKQTITVIDEHGNTVQKKAEISWPQNPITLCRMLTWRNWLFFLVGLASWTMDGYDFHVVSLSVTTLANYYGVTKTDITTSITLTLLFRSLGAAIFGIAGDFWGRKYPMVINMFIIGAMQIVTAYATTFQGFLAARAVFGIGMGGIWGNAVAMALESCPVEARGLMSGILQQGYSLGYLLAAVFNLTVVPQNGWQVLFYIGAGGSFGIGLIRLLFPDSAQFEKAKAEGKRGEHTKNFLKDVKVIFREEWRNMIYAVILMAWFNFFSHTSDDTYPTFLTAFKGLSSQDASRVVIIAKVGAFTGGTFVGHVSQSVGRRRAIFVSALMAAVLIPAWILPNSKGGLAAGGFFLGFMVQGAWGVVPGHLNEISPPAFRASFPGICYQLGNMISSPAAQMVTGISSRYYVWSPNVGKPVEAFGPTMAIALSIVSVGLATWIAIGKERLGTHFEFAVAGVGDVFHQTSPHLEEGQARTDEKPSAPGSVEEKVPHVEHEEVRQS